METEPQSHVLSTSLQELTLHSTSGEPRITSNGLAAIISSLDFGVTVLDGPMGIGKSLLLKSIAEKVQPFRTCIHVDLANEKYHGNDNALKECIQKGLASKHLLYIFDSFDEFISKCKWTIQAFFSFVKGEVLQSGALLVATRPTGVDLWYRECIIDNHYSIDGFSPECVYSYFETRELTNIKILLKQHKSILISTCRNPLICSILVDTMRRKKFNAYSVTDIMHEIVLGVANREIRRTRGEHTDATNLHSLEANHFEIICVLAFLDLVHSSKLESLESFSFFLSSFFLKYSISSLKEVETLGLLYHCDPDSYCAQIKKKLYWFLCPELRDFLAAFMLHLWPPLDQLYFLSEHAQSLIKRGKSEKDVGYSGWLQFLYGLTVRRGAECNPIRMMMSSLNELLAHCLSLNNSLQLMVFIQCLSEIHEPNLWRKLATRNISFFDMVLTANEIEMIKPCLEELISSSGFKEWVIEASPDKRKVVDPLVEKVSARAKVQVLEDNTLGDNVKLWPKVTASSSTKNQNKNVDISVFHCRAVRELLQRVLQLYTPWRLKGDCSTPSYISFLNCQCFEKAIENRIFFEPVVATHFLLLENASKKSGKGENDSTLRHVKESHGDKAIEYVILLQPCLRKLTFYLPSGGESTVIQLSGDYSPDTDYATFVAMYVEGLEEIVQCVMEQDLTPTKTEIVAPCLPINVEFKVGTVAPRISLPPSQQKLSPKIPADNTGINPSTYPSGENYAQQVDLEGGPSFGVLSVPSQAPSFGEGRETMQPVQQQQRMQQQSGRRLTNVKPGTVLFTSEPSLIPLNAVVPLPDENVLIQMGGNGQIFDGTIKGKKVAVKKTPYRSKEYAVITKVQHRNLIQLLAFIWGEENPVHKRRYFCYHVMPKLSGKEIVNL